MTVSSEPMTDEMCVERAVHGDQNAYSILVRKYQNMVYRLALSIIGNCDAAEDVAQETFLRAYENLPRLQRPASFAAWIAGIARNLCRNLLRKRKNTPLSLDYLLELGHEISAPGETPDHRIELLESLRQIITTLPPKYREVLDLRTIKEYSYEEISGFLGISLTAVKSRVHHAKKEVLKRARKEGLI